MQSSQYTNPPPQTPHPYLTSILDDTEIGILLVNPQAQPVYMNSSARELLGSDADVLPDEFAAQTGALLERLRDNQQIIERWSHAGTIVRVRARRTTATDFTVLELSVAQAGLGQDVERRLADALKLSANDAELLALLWRGLSNDEISQILKVRIGTVKSRLFRLYQRLGVKRRPAAVLRAAEVL